MSSTFAGLNIATRGLYTSQGGLAVTSNNISNLNTAGYSRQTLNQSAVGPAAVYSGRGIVGGGSQINSVDRVRDSLLDKKYWRASSALGEWNTKASSLSELESILGEPASNGFSTVMDDFYSSLETLSTTPDSDAVRTTVSEAGKAVCEYLNTAAQQLTQLREDINGELKTAVDELNSYASQIAELNDRIRAATATGSSANDLIDQRCALLDKLSALAEVEVGEVVTGKQADGTTDTLFTVRVNGVELVTGGKARQVEYYEISDGSAQDGLYGLRWQDTGEAFTPGGGELNAYLQLRDGTGTGTEYKGIPYYTAQLDKFAQTFAMAFNEGVYLNGVASGYAGHAGGVTADGTTGIRFFSYDGLSSADLMASGADTDAVYANITAATISLSEDVLNDPSKIATASASGEAGNNENINDLISICQASGMFNGGTPEDFMNSIIAALGSESAYAQRLSSSKSSIVKNIDDRRTSVSGVSSDEETANLTKYEQAYNAAATMVSTWNRIYEETVNLVSD